MTNYFLQQVFRVAAVFAMLATPAVYAANTYAPTPIAGQPGQVTAIAHWQIQSSAKAQENGAEISSAGFST
jgi:exo-1,4-beta-D-glucosaminidase